MARPIDGRLFVAIFAPDGKKLITAGGMRDVPGQIKIWNVPGGVELAATGGIRGVRSVAFDNNGKTFLTGDFSGVIKRRDAATGADIASVKAHALGANCVALSPDGKMILSAGLDGLIKLWDADTLKQRKEFRGHAGMVYSTVFFGHGNAFVTTGQDATAKIWNIGTGKETFTLRGHKGYVEAAAISPDDRIIATASWDGAVKLWDADTGVESGELLAKNGSVFAVAFTRDGKKLVSAGTDGVIRLWDVDKRQMLKEIGKHTAAVWSLKFSPDDTYLATASFDTTAKLWNMADLTEIATLKPLPLAMRVGVPPAGPEPEGLQPAVAELLEDDIDFFLDHLNNNGGNDGSVALRSEKAMYSGTAALCVTPFQRFNAQLPGWNYRIVENPKPGEFRYVRFAWKRTEAPGIMLQFHARPKTWHRYYAGTVSKSVQGWGPMIRIADEPPRNWDVVTRDLFKDFGAMTLTGVGFTALEGGGEAYFDHIYLGRTIEDLDRVTAGAKKVAEPVGPDNADVLGSGGRPRILPAAMIAAAVVLLLAIAVFLVFSQRMVKERKSALTDELDKPVTGPIIFQCSACGKKLKVKPALKGKALKCPQCGERVRPPDTKEAS
jgi:hypothetical protein